MQDTINPYLQLTSIKSTTHYIRDILLRVVDKKLQKVIFENSVVEAKKEILKDTKNEKSIVAMLTTIELYAKMLPPVEFLDKIFLTIKNDHAFFAEFFMLLKTIVQKNVKENIKKFEEEAEQHGIFGKYAFPNNRVSKKVPFEYDTDIEREVDQALKWHFNDAESKIPKKHFDILVDLIKQQQYNDVLSNYDGVIYRGMSTYEKFANELAEKDNFVFKPHSDTSSWTKSFKKAEYFARSNISKTKPIAIILSARPMDNDISQWIDCEGLYLINNSNFQFSHEEEVIVGGKVRVEIEDIVDTRSEQ